MTNQYRNCDSKRPDGTYIHFTRLEHDCDSDPRDYLFQDEDYREADQARLDAFNAGKWWMIGIQAKADILIVRNGHGITHTLTSGGCWSIESDSGEDYLNEIFAQECAALLADIKALATNTNPVITGRPD